MNTEDQYREAVSHALAGFQLIEASLKSYVEEYHAAIRRHLPATLTYEYGRTDVEEASLGKLVNLFSRMNGNTGLIEKLRRLQRQRDVRQHRHQLHVHVQRRLLGRRCDL